MFVRCIFHDVDVNLQSRGTRCTSEILNRGIPPEAFSSFQGNGFTSVLKNFSTPRSTGSLKTRAVLSSDPVASRVPDVSHATLQTVPPCSASNVFSIEADDALSVSSFRLAFTRWSISGVQDLSGHHGMPWARNPVDSPSVRIPQEWTSLEHLRFGMDLYLRYSLRAASVEVQPARSQVGTESYHCRRHKSDFDGSSPGAVSRGLSTVLKTRWSIQKTVRGPDGAPGSLRSSYLVYSVRSYYSQEEGQAPRLHCAVRLRQV